MDIYSDLPVSIEINKPSYIELSQELETIVLKNKGLLEENRKLVEENKILHENFKKLFNTAKLEIQRKDKQLNFI